MLAHGFWAGYGQAGLLHSDGIEPWHGECGNSAVDSPAGELYDERRPRSVWRPRPR